LNFFFTRYPKIGHDSYILCLIALVLHNIGRKEEASAMAHSLSVLQKSQGFISGADTSITSSYGSGLVIEATW
jgi:hypothetical protein